MRKSHAKLSSSPPPRAGPSIAAKVGIGRFSSLPRAALKPERNLVTCSLLMVRLSARSAPAQKEPSVVDFTMSTFTLSIISHLLFKSSNTRTHLLSKWAHSRQSPNSWSNFMDIAFFVSGRLRFRQTTPGCDTTGSRNACLDACTDMNLLHGPVCLAVVRKSSERSIVNGKLPSSWDPRSNTHSLASKLVEFVARISHFGPTNRNRALQIARPKMY